MSPLVSALIGGAVTLLVAIITAASGRATSKAQAKTADIESWDRLTGRLEERVEALEEWRRDNEPRLKALDDVLRRIAWKLQARITWRQRGSPPPPPHTDEEILEDIEAIYSKEKNVSRQEHPSSSRDH